MKQKCNHSNCAYPNCAYPCPNLPDCTEKQKPMALKKAVFTVLEGFTIPDAARKILETAYYANLQSTEFTDERNYCERCGKRTNDIKEKNT